MATFSFEQATLNEAPLNVDVIKNIENPSISPLNKLINGCINDNTFQFSLKQAVVVLIFKNITDLKTIGQFSF